MHDNEQQPGITAAELSTNIRDAFTRADEALTLNMSAFKAMREAGISWRELRDRLNIPALQDHD